MKTQETKKKGGSVKLKITAPTFRSQYDVSIPEDIVEEIGRMFGYDTIPSVPPRIESTAVAPNRERLLERGLKESIARAGRFLKRIIILSQTWTIIYCLAKRV